MLAEVLGVERDRVVLTNGGAEAIALVAAECPTGRVEHPEFSLYERHLGALDPAGPRWRSNPSSPLGALADAADTAAVWDEAYYQLATGRWTRGDDDAWRVGSLTKLWACPGLRVGYVIAPDASAARRIARRQPRWSLNALAVVAIEALVPVAELSRWAVEIADRRRQLADMVRSHGLTVTDTDAGWVLVRQPGLRADLVAHRVLVRDCASFGLVGWHRIAVPDDRGFERLGHALARVTTEGRP